MIKDRLKNNKGITLIIVIVTVVVMIIITSVTIGTLNSNRTIDKAKETRENIVEFGNTVGNDQTQIWDMIKSSEED